MIDDLKNSNTAAQFKNLEPEIAQRLSLLIADVICDNLFENKFTVKVPSEEKFKKEFHRRIVDSLLVESTASQKAQNENENINSRIHKLVRYYTPANASKSSNPVQFDLFNLNNGKLKEARQKQIRSFKKKLLIQMRAQVGLTKNKIIKGVELQPSLSAVKSFLEKKFNNGPSISLFDHKKIKQRSSIMRSMNRAKTQTIQQIASGFNETSRLLNNTLVGNANRLIPATSVNVNLLRGKRSDEKESLTSIWEINKGVKIQPLDLSKTSRSERFGLSHQLDRSKDSPAKARMSIKRQSDKYQPISLHIDVTQPRNINAQAHELSENLFGDVHARKTLVQVNREEISHNRYENPATLLSTNLVNIQKGSRREDSETEQNQEYSLKSPYMLNRTYNHTSKYSTQGGTGHKWMKRKTGMNFRSTDRSIGIFTPQTASLTEYRKAYIEDVNEKLAHLSLSIDQSVDAGEYNECLKTFSKSIGRQFNSLYSKMARASRGHAK